MKIFVLLNRNAGTYESAKPLLESFKADSRISLAECDSETDVSALTHNAIAQGHDVICAGGGDGTIHTVVNALRTEDYPKVRLGLLPLGTGNDLCRSLGIPTDPLEAFALVSDETRAAERRIDVIEARTTQGKRICVNLASGGFGGEVEKKLDPELKARWKTLAYARAAMRAVTDLKEFRVRASFDGGPTQEFSTLSIVVANGVTAGGGFEVAPHADPTDRRIDVVITHVAPRLQLAAIAAQLLVGDYTQSENVSHLRVRTVHFESEPAMDFSVDGSLFGKTPIEFSLIPGALRVLIPRESARGAA